MTNEERIYKLCECVTDLIEELGYSYEELGNQLEWIKDNIISIMHDVYDK